MTDNAPIFFWQETHPHWGWLSQWYAIEFEHDGITYVTTEMWMMVQKAKLFKDETLEIKESVKKMLMTKNPQEHQDLGRKVANYDGKIWNENKERIVEEGNYHKFTKSKETHLEQKLLETRERELVEASPVDRIWGVGYDEYSADSHREDWRLNLLGKAITRVRDRIRERKGRIDAE